MKFKKSSASKVVTIVGFMFIHLFVGCIFEKKDPARDARIMAFLNMAYVNSSDPLGSINDNLDSLRMIVKSSVAPVDSNVIKYFNQMNDSILSYALMKAGPIYDELEPVDYTRSDLWAVYDSIDPALMNKYVARRYGKTVYKICDVLNNNSYCDSKLYNNVNSGLLKVLDAYITKMEVRKDSLKKNIAERAFNYSPVTVFNSYSDHVVSFENGFENHEKIVYAVYSCGKFYQHRECLHYQYANGFRNNFVSSHKGVVKFEDRKVERGEDAEKVKLSVVLENEYYRPNEDSEWVVSGQEPNNLETIWTMKELEIYKRGYNHSSVSGRAEYPSWEHAEGITSSSAPYFSIPSFEEMCGYEPMD